MRPAITRVYVKGHKMKIKFICNKYLQASKAMQLNKYTTSTLRAAGNGIDAYLTNTYAMNTERVPPVKIEILNIFQVLMNEFGHVFDHYVALGHLFYVVDCKFFNLSSISLHHQRILKVTH